MPLSQKTERGQGIIRNPSLRRRVYLFIGAASVLVELVFKECIASHRGLLTAPFPSKRPGDRVKQRNVVLEKLCTLLRWGRLTFGMSKTCGQDSPPCTSISYLHTRIGSLLRAYPTTTTPPHVLIMGARAGFRSLTSVHAYGVHDHAAGHPNFFFWQVV